MPQQKLNLLQFAAGRVAQAGQVRRQSCGDSLAIPARPAYSFTRCQITFSVMLSPQTDPFLLTQRNIRPWVIPADLSQTSTAALTQYGTGTVRICAAWPIRSAITQCSSLLKVVYLQSSHLTAAQTAAKH